MENTYTQDDHIERIILNGRFVIVVDVTLTENEAEARWLFDMMNEYLKTGLNNQSRFLYPGHHFVRTLS